jgi:hypothetical protein
MAREDPDTLLIETPQILAERLLGKAVGGNSPAQNTARFGCRLEHVAGISQKGQEVSGGKPGRTGPCNRDPLLSAGKAHRQRLVAVSFGRIGQEALQGVDGDGGIIFPPIADPLARMEANTAADSGKGILPQDPLPRLPEESLGDEHLDFGDVFAGGAACRAGGGLVLIAGAEKTPRSCFIPLRSEAGTGNKESVSHYRCIHRYTVL